MNNKIKKIHFTGIKGVGMAPLAIIAKEAGFEVTGSDVDEEFITDASLIKAGIKSMIGFDPSRVNNCDLLITTGAHGGFDNPETKRAKEKGIPVWPQGEAVGKYMNEGFLGKKFEGISIAGAHGKTTTTAMIATILKENKLDPTFLIGTGEVLSLGSCGHFGKSKYFVAEADEYSTEPQYDKTPKLMWQKPKVAVITNIEFDHPDLYPSINEMTQAFLDFSSNIEENGSLILCADDVQSLKLLKTYKGKAVTFGFSKDADFYIEKVSMEQDKMFFWVNAGNTSLGEFYTQVTGEHNCLNALSAIIACLELGLSIESIKKGLAVFKGTKRRFEFVGNLSSGAYLYDDYAHHPTEIKKTLTAFRKTYPNKKIVTIFQPHTFSRTKSLFEQFVGSFSSSDVVILTDIFSSSREEADDSVSSKLLVDEISKIHKDVFYMPKLSDVVKYVSEKSFNKDFIIITMGAGNVYKIAKELIK